MWRDYLIVHVAVHANLAPTGLQVRVSEASVATFKIFFVCVCLISVHPNLAFALPCRICDPLAVARVDDKR